MATRRRCPLGDRLTTCPRRRHSVALLASRQVTSLRVEVWSDPMIVNSSIGSQPDSRSRELPKAFWGQASKRRKLHCWTLTKQQMYY
jgi:hypothetical protein